MKVNTDGVLLAAWMRIGSADTSMLELGTGCGVMAIMAAQRLLAMQTSPLSAGVERVVDAVEIDPLASMDAEYNFRRVEEEFGGGVKLNIVNLPANEYALGCSRSYDLLFTNPPYFSNSLKNRDPSRTVARHNSSLSQSDIIRISLKLLSSGGRLALILPCEEGREFIEKTEFLQKAAREGESFLAQSRECYIRTTPSKEPKRILLEFVSLPDRSHLPALERDSIIIHNERGEYSEKYISLTGDFYLNF